MDKRFKMMSETLFSHKIALFETNSFLMLILTCGGENNIKHLAKTCLTYSFLATQGCIAIHRGSEKVIHSFE